MTLYCRYLKVAKNVSWVVGAALILANWPYTLLGIVPANRRLNATANESADSAYRLMIETWGRLHAVRSGLGIAAALAYLWALN